MHHTLVSTAKLLVEQTYIPLKSTPSKTKLLDALNITYTPSKQFIIQQLTRLSERQLKKVIASLRWIQHESIPKIKKNPEQTISDTYNRRTASSQKAKILDYKSYLKSDRWKQVREQAKKNTLLRNCFFCKSPFHLELHHITYKHIGTYEELKYSRGMVTTCRSCHQQIHNISKSHKIAVHKATAILAKHSNKNLPW